MKVSVRILRPSDTDHEVLWTAMAVVIGVVGWLLFRAEGPLPWPECVFKTVTGWPCVTCGATRAVQAVLAFDLPLAWRMNPLVTLVAVAWGAYAVYGGGAVLQAWPRVSVALESRECARLRIVAVAAVAATWIFLVADGR